MSSHEYVQEIVRLSRLGVEVIARPAGDFKRIAKVPGNEVALSWKMSPLSLPQMRHWKEGPEAYVAVPPRTQTT